MDENAMFILLIVERCRLYARTSVDNKHALARRSHSLGKCRSSEARPDDNPIHHSYLCNASIEPKPSSPTLGEGGKVLGAPVCSDSID